MGEWGVLKAPLIVLAWVLGAIYFAIASLPTNNIILPLAAAACGWFAGRSTHQIKEH